MIVAQKIEQKNGLGVYAKQMVAFMCCLLMVAVYQHVILYYKGLVDNILNQSLWLYFVNQIGFTAVVGFILLIPFRLFEGQRPGNGKKIVALMLILILCSEFLLTTFYIQSHSLFSANTNLKSQQLKFSNLDLLLTLLVLFLLFYNFRLLAKRCNWPSRFLKKMYPFTILLAIMVFGMLFTNKKPINQNKFQYFITDLALQVFDFNTYEGESEYPFLKKVQTDSIFKTHFNLGEKNPNFVVILVQGLGNDFVGKEAIYRKFAPFLNDLSQKSLLWENHLTNALSTKGVITSLTTSIPSIESEQEDLKLNRNTLFGLLKEAGYKTSYFYGGNNSLLGMNKFLFQDRVDLIIDKSKFDPKYQLAPPNDNGTLLGYPDGELFRKWEETFIPSTKPKFELFINLSSVSGNFPNQEKYRSEVDGILKKNYFSNKAEWSVKRQKSFFASMLYVDESIKAFLEKHQKTNEFENTIYIITGTQNAPFLAKQNDLEDYHVPLMIYGKGIKNPQRFSNITSHSDLTVSLLSIVQGKAYPSQPKFLAGIGHGLCYTDENKEIPLFRSENRIREYIKGNHFYTSGKVYKIGLGFDLVNTNDRQSVEQLKSEFKNYQAAHKHVLKENRLLPDSLTIFRSDKSSYNREELIWITSVFNGKNFDKAYEKARSLAHNGNTERALLLSEYILDHIPNHVDAMILQGRIYAWDNKYHKAIEILKNAMANNPKYHDSYSAALDVCYWAKDKKLATEIYGKMKENNVISIELDKKVQRCLKNPKILNEVTTLMFELDEY